MPEAEPHIHRPEAVPRGHPLGLGVVSGDQQVEAIDAVLRAPAIGVSRLLLVQSTIDDPGNGEPEVLAVPRQDLARRSRLGPSPHPRKVGKIQLASHGGAS